MVTAYRSRLLAMTHPNITPRQRSRFEPRPGAGGAAAVDVTGFDRRTLDTPGSAGAGFDFEGIEIEAFDTGEMTDAGADFRTTAPLRPVVTDRPNTGHVFDRPGSQSTDDNAEPGGTTVDGPIATSTGTGSGTNSSVGNAAANRAEQNQNVLDGLRRVIEPAVSWAGSRLAEVRRDGDPPGFNAVRNSGESPATSADAEVREDSSVEQPGGSVAALRESAFLESETDDRQDGQGRPHLPAEALRPTNRTGRQTAGAPSTSEGDVGNVARLGQASAPRAAVSTGPGQPASTVAAAAVPQRPTDGTDPSWRRTLTAVHAATSSTREPAQRREPTDAVRPAADMPPRPPAGSPYARQPPTESSGSPLEVTVRIGRVEVRPIAAALPPRSPATEPRATTSLEDYLQARISGRVG